MAPTHADGADPVVRKAQLTGGSTFTVSLPKDWADRQGLDAGTELWLYALEDRVVVAPTATTNGSRAVRVDVGGSTREPWPGGSGPPTPPAATPSPCPPRAA